MILRKQIKHVKILFGQPHGNANTRDVIVIDAGDMLPLLGILANSNSQYALCFIGTMVTEGIVGVAANFGVAAMILELRRRFWSCGEVFILIIIPKMNYSAQWVKSLAWKQVSHKQCYSKCNMHIISDQRYMAAKPPALGNVN
jgi:hypothetical protein